MDKKKIAEAYILGIPFGLFGVHHFYLGRKGFGILYACTLGLFGLGYIYDLIRMRWLVKHVNKHGTEVKMLSDVYLIAVFGGIFGAHHFYLGNKKLGIFYACTLGMLTLGWIADLFRIKHLMKDHNDQKVEKSLDNAYIFALPPFGIFGAYHYYLGNAKLGLIYTLTFGTFGIGWITDLFRMKNLVKAANDPTSDYGNTKVTAYILCVSPLGIVGAHHVYLKRYPNAVLYAVTLGLFGLGWILDMLRLPVLYARYANKDGHKYPDEAYIYWFPFGFLGLHHFYLENKKWGLIYACTLGCLGIGWLIDGIRIPRLVKEYNRGVEESKFNNFRLCELSKFENEANNYLQPVSSGDYLQPMPSGDYLQPTESGEYSQLTQSEDYSQPVPSGNVKTKIKIFGDGNNKNFNKNTKHENQDESLIYTEPEY